MKVKKSIDLDTDSINIVKSYEAKLITACGVEGVASTKYINCMESFRGMLQEITDKAFNLGLEEGKKE